MRRYLFFFAITLACFSLAAQEAEQEQALDDLEQEELVQEADDIEDIIQTQENLLIEMDINTSTLVELADWSRRLGLPEGGNREDLANRLRSYYNIPHPLRTDLDAPRVIVIESARTTEYFTLELVDEEYARLRGDVVITLKDDDVTHRISAWEILYNRTRNVVTASGGVEYVRAEGNSIETFRGEFITVNLDNWSSIFLDGISERSTAGADTAYVFSGTVISRNNEEVTTLSGAEISNAQNPDALWKISATRLWLLPGSDWAALNAVLWVGNIPVLWFPFFYYPADEIIFHPAIGTRSREGSFVQTTTFVLGRPRTSGATENSLINMFGSDVDGDLVREGLFLRRTNRRTRSTESPSLAVLFDAYTNLGYYLGTELTLPRRGNFGVIDLSFGLGLTRNIYQAPYGNTPFARYDGTSDWNTSNLLSFEIPFRYRMEMTGSYLLGYGSLNWNVPFYSDPFVNRDFMNRTVPPDWLTMLRGEPGATDRNTTDTSISSYEWRLSGSFSPRFPNLAPYISSISFPSISSALFFSSRNTNPRPAIVASPANPDMMFFFPNRFVMLSASATMAGTPYTTGRVIAVEEEERPPMESFLPGLPISPWEETEQPDSVLSVEGPLYSLRPPVLAQRFDTPIIGGPRLSFNYTFNPSVASELQFRSHANNWGNSNDINLTEISSVLSRIRADTSLGFSVDQTGGGLYSGSFRITGTGAWQDYNYLNEMSEEFSPAGAIGSARRRAYSETFITTSYDFSSSVRPFYQNRIWGSSSIQYNLRGLLARTIFDETGVTDTLDNPSWNWDFGEWTPEKIDSHSLTTSFNASIRDNVQSFSVSTVLPPRTPQISENLVLRFWISETSVRNSIIEPFNSDERVIQPIFFTQNFRFNTHSSFDQYVAFDPELSEFTAMTTTLRLWNFNARYQMSHIIPYYLNYNRIPFPNLPAGWIQVGDRTLSPQDLTFSYSIPTQRRNFWNDRLVFSARLGTNLVFDLQRYTYSRFSLSYDMDLDISNFMSFNLSITSENNQIYRYFQGLPFFTNHVPLPPGLQTNFFIDLFHSFRFDDARLRRDSAFKLRSFNMNFIHYLGDWNATFGINLLPYLDTSTGAIPSWRFNNEIYFTVRWVPIEEIRTEVYRDRDWISFE